MMLGSTGCGMYLSRNSFRERSSLREAKYRRTASGMRRGDCDASWKFRKVQSGKAHITMRNTHDASEFSKLLLSVLGGMCWNEDVFFFAYLTCR